MRLSKVLKIRLFRHPGINTGEEDLVMLTDYFKTSKCNSVTFRGFLRFRPYCLSICYCVFCQTLISLIAI